MSIPEEFRHLSESAMKPQLRPSDHAYTILQNHGPENGGWGPCVVQLPGMAALGPFVYTGEAEHVLALLREAARRLAQDTRKPTRLVKFTHREDVFTVGGSS